MTELRALMTTPTLLDSLKHNVRTAQATAGIVVNHSQDLVHTGIETLGSAKDVLADAQRDVRSVVSRASAELRSTFKEGREKLSYKLRHLDTPTRKEAAEARKLEVRAKKRHKSQKTDVDTGPASTAGFTPPPSMDAT